jgi:hypothetical protein
LRVGSRAGPGATSSGPSAGGIGSSVLRTARRSAKAGFIEAVGVIGVVVSHAARNARANKPMISFMIERQYRKVLLSLSLHTRIWQGFAPELRSPVRHTGFARRVGTEGRPSGLSGGRRPPLPKSQQAGSPFAERAGGPSSCGAGSSEPQASATFALIRSAR